MYFRNIFTLTLVPLLCCSTIFVVYTFQKCLHTFGNFIYHVYALVSSAFVKSVSSIIFDLVQSNYFPSFVDNKKVCCRIVVTRRRTIVLLAERSTCCLSTRHTCRVLTRTIFVVNNFPYKLHLSRISRFILINDQVFIERIIDIS